jgi:inorganic pyrophosphatase
MGHMASTLTVTVDRPLGFRNEFGTVYPLNYGYVAGVVGGDGELQDAYIITKPPVVPLATFTGKWVATIHRRDDNEVKWVVADPDLSLTSAEIAKQTRFLEQYFDSEIEMH